MLSAKSFMVLMILPFLISRVNFSDISAMVDGVFDTLKSFWMVSASFNNSMISPAYHSSIRFFNEFKRSFYSDFREGVCKGRLGITIIALNVISFKENSCIHSIISLETSSMKFFPDSPDGNKKRFFFQYTIFS